jgi:hypothetical protein
MNVVRIRGYTRHLKVISLIKLIRDMTGDGLAVTKDRVDHILETGESLDIVLPDSQAAVDFASRTTSIGAVVDPDNVSDIRSDPNQGT